MLPIFTLPASLIQSILTTIQLLLKCENKCNLERGVFTPETKELQVRERCQLGGEREEGRWREKQKGGEKKNQNIFFSPLKLNSALAWALTLPPYFVAVTTRGERGETDRERERGGGEESAD